MYGVWQTGRHYCEPGLQPWAVSGSLSKLEEWAKLNIPRQGDMRLFFAEHTGPGQDWTDARWTVIGHLYVKHGITAKRLDPERYSAHREGRRLWNDADGKYPVPTDEDWKRRTVDVDEPSH